MAKKSEKPLFAFLFVAPKTDRTKHFSMIETPLMKLATVGVKDYKEAVKAAKELVAKGVSVIELCGGFGNEGAGLVAKAVKGKAKVGVVKFDSHPGLGFKSGDELF